MSASILLCQATVEKILNMLPGERVEEFGWLIGIDAVVCILFFLGGIGF